jgi:hypothetical protein
MHGAQLRRSFAIHQELLGFPAGKQKFREPICVQSCRFPFLIFCRLRIFNLIRSELEFQVESFWKGGFHSLVVDFAPGSIVVDATEGFLGLG